MPGTCRVPPCGRACPITAAFCVDHELHPAPGVPWPKHFKECLGCLAVAFLRPIRICAGSLDVLVVDLCLSCRVGWKDSQDACLATSIEHAPRRHLPRVRPACGSA